MLYDRLDSLRERAQRRLDAVHRGEHALTHQSMSERQSYHELLTGRLSQLGAVERGLCFGRLDNDDDTRLYIGRIGLFDDDYEPVLVDWRAPAAQAFYGATPARRLGVRRRRHLRTHDRTVVGIEDDVLDLATLGDMDDTERRQLSGEAALLASLAAGRTGRMNEIVATIQAEQDRVIRSGLAGILVVEGGPGTGKTVVALHRAAYLLYTHRARLARRGVLIVGPNPTFTRYIDQVLPSLGETDVVLATLAELYPGVSASGEDEPLAARVKGDPRMADVVAAAVRDRQRVPEHDLELVVDGEPYVLSRAVCERVRDRARARAGRDGELANRARRHFVRDILGALTRQAVDRLGADLLGDADVQDIRRELAAAPEVRAALDGLWPELTPTELLADLYSSADLIASAAPEFTAAERAALLRPGPPAAQRWTPADVPLLDEAAEHLGELDRAVYAAAAAERRERGEVTEETGYARAGVELQQEYEEFADDVTTTDDDVDPLAEGVVRRYRGDEGGGPVSEGALGDRQWVYGHVIVDEAQELPAMAWRLLMRRCPARSMTLVGDLAQASAPGAPATWAEVLDLWAQGRWRRERLTVNYRTPAPIMALAADVLATIDPDAAPPGSVRDGAEPWWRPVEEAELAPALSAAVDEELAALAAGANPSGDHADGDHSSDRGEPAGRLAVIVPESRFAGLGRQLRAVRTDVALGGSPAVLDARVALLTVAQAKGLEFDSVVVVDPAAILEAVRPGACATYDAHGAGDLYVALTRATRRLGVVTTGPLPDVLARLARPTGPDGERGSRRVRR
ncbi:DNA helicase IV [Actinopolymorpha cephalotaxi]|uniref:DNA helicase IV n=1 Tax=Actinopolymorpha cephalotaxi TaxID=504797 RepID=A0A1I2SNB3_9ACTN|nr:AAA family ATPase [Actinopolymorpha cephalotaxi]NYH83947.1 DNA helicase IV [Actinopolymorpha cephalotaxi]SFG51401.1 DNA helicase IV [Actinopolymorpha cephalotaxi]